MRRRLRSWRESLTPGMLIAVAVRVVLAALGVAVLLIPLPALTGNPAAGIAFFALPVPFIIAWRPGSAWVTVLLVVAVLTWVVTSLFEGAPPVPLTIGFGCLLYVVHATAALAAALPPVQRIEPVLVIHAIGRVLAVLACCVPLMLAVLLAPQGHGSPLLALVGVLSALGVAAMLAVLTRRGPAS